MKTLKKGDRFRNYMGELCFITYLDKELVRLSYICKKPYAEIWQRKEFIDEIKGNRFFVEPTPKVNRLNIGDHLLEYQLNIIGKTMEDAKKDDLWVYNWTITKRQKDYFKAYAIPLIKKTFRCNTKKAEQTFEWFNLQFGLRLKD